MEVRSTLNKDATLKLTQRRDVYVCLCVNGKNQGKEAWLHAAVSVP